MLNKEYVIGDYKIGLKFETKVLQKKDYKITPWEQKKINFKNGKKLKIKEHQK